MVAARAPSASALTPRSSAESVTISAPASVAVPKNFHDAESNVLPVRVPGTQSLRASMRGFRATGSATTLAICFGEEEASWLMTPKFSDI